MRLFGSDRIKVIVDKVGLADDEPLTAGVLTKQIESAQRNIESRHFQARKSVLQFDDVMNQQRSLIYKQRQQVLHGDDMRETVMGMIKALIDETCDRTCSGEVYDWDLASLAEYVEHLCILPGTIEAKKAEMETWELDDLKNWLLQEANTLYKEREALFATHQVDIREAERIIILNAVNNRWMDHIDAMDQLREGISLRAYAQHDPITEYRLESYDMFDEMVRLIREDTVKRMYQAKFVQPKREDARPLNIQTKKADTVQNSPAGAKLASGQTGMNQLCPCGSGKKYKHCCGKKF